MTEPNAPPSGAATGAARAEQEERVRRALRDLGRELLKTAFVVRGLQETPDSLFPSPPEITAAQEAELWSAAIGLLSDAYMRMHQTANQAIGAAIALLDQQ
jgi:hypothetical protein